MAMDQVERDREKYQQGHEHEPCRKRQRVKDEEGYDHEPGRKILRERPARSWPWTRQKEMERNTSKVMAMNQVERYRD